MHSYCPGLYLYKRHNYVYLLRFKVLMELIIHAVIKFMGAVINDHWDLRDTGTTRDYDTLAWSLGWQSGPGPGWQSHKHVTFSPVGPAWLPKWLCPMTAKRANNQGENVHISNSTTPIVLIGWVVLKTSHPEPSHGLIGVKINKIKESIIYAGLI